jgi:hypothetical protein
LGDAEAGCRAIADKRRRADSREKRGRRAGQIFRKREQGKAFHHIMSKTFEALYHRIQIRSSCALFVFD